MENNEEEEEEEMEFEIWPVQHPIEPTDEDRPVKCPIPDSSLINEEGKREKKQLGESLRKRAEEKSKQSEEDEITKLSSSVRKRHHTLTGSDDLPSFSAMHQSQSLTIFQVLQQVDHKLE